MPVRANTGLAGVLLADELGAPPAGAKSDERKDAQKVDFGAALGGLIAAMAPNQPVPSRAAGDSVTGSDLPGGGGGGEVAAGARNHISPALRPSAVAPALLARASIPERGAWEPIANTPGSSAAADIPVSPNGPVGNAPVPANTPPSAPAANSPVSVVPIPPIPSIARSEPALRAAKEFSMIARATVGPGQPLETLRSSPVAENEPFSDLAAPHSATSRAAAPQGASVPSNARSAVPQESAEHQPQEAAGQAPGLCGPENTAATDAEPAPRAEASVQAQMAEPAATQVHPMARREVRLASETAAPAPAPAASGDRPAVAHAPAAAAVNRVTESGAPAPAAKVARLSVELAGGTAQATVRERSGVVAVKIVAATAQSAHHISKEVDALKQALDSAGLKLAEAEVSYRQQHQNREHSRGDSHGEPRQRRAASNEVFILEEVNE